MTSEQRELLIKELDRDVKLTELVAQLRLSNALLNLQIDELKKRKKKMECPTCDSTLLTVNTLTVFALDAKGNYGDMIGTKVETFECTECNFKSKKAEDFKLNPNNYT